MSKITKWKVEKAKVKVVFRLQFHATHIPQTGWNNLFISFVPADSGKATSKTNKTTVRNGACKWADPIYETTRLLQDANTKHYEEKLYKLVVAMGTSRSSILGEASINISNYVDALKPTVVALPLQGSNSGAILNVTVQLLTSKTGFREFEQQREVSDRGLQTNPDQNCGKISKPGDVVASCIDEVNHRAKSKPETKELPTPEEESCFSEEYADSAAGFDGSSNTSDGTYAEKLNNSGSCEINGVKSTLPGDLGGISPTQDPTTKNGPCDPHFLEQGNTDWVSHWGAEKSVDNEIAMVYEENSQLRRVLESADLFVHELRQEITSLQRNADDMGVETQKLIEQLTVEISSKQELAKEVCLLKSECVRFRGDLEWLRDLKMSPLTPTMKSIDEDQSNIVQCSSVRWLKVLSVVEDKMREVQNKVQLGLHEKDSMSLHSDLEALLFVLQYLKKGTEHSVLLLDEISTGKANTKISEVGSPKHDHVMSDTGLGVELCHPEGVLSSGLLAHDTGSSDAPNSMQGQIRKLLRELDECKTEQESLKRKMDQMECYYEALIQELEENQKQMLGELQNLQNEHSSCIYTVSSTKAQMEAMHQQMNDELLQLAAERCNLDDLNKELERRAVSSEAALKRARLNYSIAVKQLQKDLEVLSLQVVSMYETNENLIRKAYEASHPSFQGCEEAVSRELDAENSYNDKLLEDLRMSLKIQEDLHKTIQEELSYQHLANVHLDVLSMMLHQALIEASADNRLAKEELCEFAKQLELSSKSNEALKLALSEENAILVSRCNDLASKNLTLEADLRTLSDEKHTLREKIGELESLVFESRSYKSKYEDCNTDKVKLENQLEQATAELKIELQSMLSDNRERLIAYDQLKAELDCSVMSLDCCKEEKKQLMASLQECNDKKSRLADEVELMTEQLENLKLFLRSPENKDDRCCIAQKCLNELFRGENLVDESLPSTSYCGKVGEMDLQPQQYERMRIQNMLPMEDANAVESDNFEGSQSDHLHLEKVTKKLGNMSSLYNDSSSGNSIKRAFDSELDLAESLQSKKKPSIQIQSSLKLNNADATEFQSFRDINELIKEMMEMKGKYGAMEAELQEMHERYSLLSLQFAEVEGERQKLLCRSPSSSLEKSSL